MSSTEQEDQKGKKHYRFGFGESVIQLSSLYSFIHSVKLQPEQQKLGILEEDDEFEEFPVEGNN